MKIRGKKIEGPNRELILIPRGGDAEDIALWAQAVLDMEPFDKMCALPMPPGKRVKGGGMEYDLEDEEYKSQLNLHADKRMAYLVLKSLDLPENELEWETVKIGEHKTWLLWRDELRGAGFSEIEIQRIEAGCYNANCLNEVRLNEARANFLRGMAEAARATSTLPTEPSTTKSGEPANDGT